MIIRFFSQEGKKRQVKQTGLTLEQAQEHCNLDSTRKAGVWFDGYTLQDSLR